MNEPEFSVEPLNQVKRIPSRGAYDHRTVFEIIDAAPIGHLAILTQQAHPMAVIPMLHARRDQSLLFHGSQASRLLKYLASGQPVTVSFAVVDGLVLAKSLFHHSMNYRSAVVFGRGREIVGDDAKMAALKCISDRIMPGRWEDARLPNPQELKATKVVEVAIENASAKIRSGGPKEEPEDVSLPYWTGVVPLTTVAGAPQSDPLSRDIPLPDYLASALSKYA
jgi:nitroimidazol reductase NimA-like FMN-containing flavoprotein (pyridoxamine 5'-phosphate oxidase superfamily)